MDSKQRRRAPLKRHLLYYACSRKTGFWLTKMLSGVAGSAAKAGTTAPLRNNLLAESRDSGPIPGWSGFLVLGGSLNQEPRKVEAGWINLFNRQDPSQGPSLSKNSQGLHNMMKVFLALLLTAASWALESCVSRPQLQLIAGISRVALSYESPIREACRASIRFSNSTSPAITYDFDATACSGLAVASFVVPQHIPNGDAFVNW